MRFGLRHVRYFIAVAEELHYRRASERLGVAQPALSRTIQSLEQSLDVTLFVRSNRSVEITDAGETFLRGCRDILNVVERTVEETRQVQQGRIGILRIGYTDAAIAGALPAILQKFQTNQPGIVLQPHHGVTNSQLRKLQEGELDIGCVTGPVHLEGYEQFTIQNERLICVVYDNHRLAKRKKIRLEELAEEKFVHGSHKDWEHFYANFLPLCRQSGFIPNVVQEAFNSAAILGLVACGMGVTVLQESARSSVSKGLVALTLEGVPASIPTVALWKQDNLRGSKKFFIEFLLSQGSRTT